jgi:hypothetical protein
MLDCHDPFGIDLSWHCCLNQLSETSAGGPTLPRSSRLRARTLSSAGCRIARGGRAFPRPRKTDRCLRIATVKDDGKPLSGVVKGCLANLLCRLRNVALRERGNGFSVGGRAHRMGSPPADEAGQSYFVRRRRIRSHLYNVVFWALISISLCKKSRPCPVLLSRLFQ